MDLLGVLDEAVLSLRQRIARTLLTGLGTLLGVGVLVSVLGLTTTASSQIDHHFTALSATEVAITQVPPAYNVRTLAFPLDFERRAARVDGVVSAGLTWKVTPAAGLEISRPGAGSSADNGNIDCFAASPGAFTVAHTTVQSGRLFDGYARENLGRVAVLGPTAARDLNLAQPSLGASVLINGVPFTVIGIVSDVDRHPELLNAVTIPDTTAQSLFGDPTADPATGWVEVRRGAGDVVASQLARAISPTDPGAFQVIPPANPTHLHGAIGSDMRTLLLVLAIVCLVVGMVGIANTMLVTVMERIGEIGLRRALGARRSHVALQFLAEAAIIGLAGGLLGSLIGTGVVISVSVVHHWTAVMPPALVALGPVVGAVTALLAAVLPALRGASTEPVVALRAGGD